MHNIAIPNLFYMLIPIAIVWYFYYKWIDNKSEILIATFRMVVQLVAIGYALAYIFAEDSFWMGLLIIFVMVSVSSIIAMRNVSNKSSKEYFRFFIPILISGTFMLILVIEFVLDLDKFYEPKFVIPIAGMIYANTMNAISLASERFEKEYMIHAYHKARSIALKASLIPQINSFFAVGLVSLPGMMTGQILSGVDPLIAVRYQIVVMAMVFGSAGIGVILYLLSYDKNLYPPK